MSLTGANADHRFRMKGAEVAAFARAVAAQLGVVPGAPVLSPPSSPAPPGPWRPTSPPTAAARWCWPACASRRRVHALVHAMNAALGNVGRDGP